MLKKQIVNFLIVGIVNTIFGYSVYAILISQGFNYVISVLLATIMGILFNFKTIGKFVFQSHDNSLILKFFFVYFIVFIVNISIIKLFKINGLNDYLSGAIAIVPSAIISFILNKVYVFKR